MVYMKKNNSKFLDRYGYTILKIFSKNDINAIKSLIRKKNAIERDEFEL